MTAAGCSVLVVEDEDTVRRLLVQVLTDAGFATDEAATAGAALELASLADIVLTDLALGAESGLELIATLRRRFPRVPVIAMSGNPSLLADATHAGAIFVLAKPFELDQLRVATTLALVAVRIAAECD